MNVVKYDLKKIKPYGRNHKKHSDAQIRLLVKSINEFGITQPILINPQGVIIAGEGRYHAFKKMGMEQVPVIVLDLPPEKEKVYRIADNELNTFGVTNDFKIKIEELGDFKMDGEMLELANMKPEDFLFSIEAPKFDSKSNSIFSQAAADLEQSMESGEDQEEAPEKEESSDQGSKPVESKTFHFYIEIRGAYTKDQLKKLVEERLTELKAIVR